MEKKNIEDLSNLVFGLALTIGAVTLVRPDADDPVQLTPSSPASPSASSSSSGYGSCTTG